MIAVSDEEAFDLKEKGKEMVKSFASGLLALGATATLLAGTATSAWSFELKAEPKVAFIYAAAAKDGGWNEAIDAGRAAVEKDLGLTVAVAENVPEDATKLRAAIDLFVKRGFNIIVGTTYGYSEPIAEAAKAYPDVAFLNASGTTNGANLESFYARTYQAWYLAGIAAGSVTESKKLGMVAGFPVGVVNWDANAFILGARSVDPSIETVVVYTNSWWDPVKEGQVAEAILDQNADVIATDLSSTAPLAAAERRGASSVGYQLDMSHAAPEGILTSVVFHWDRYLVPTIKSITDGTWTPQEYGAFEGIDKGVIGLAPFGKRVPDAAKAKIEEVQAKMVAGEFDPFSGPIEKQDGSVAVPAGEKVSDEALWSMDYFVKGAIGTMPAAQ